MLTLKKVKEMVKAPVHTKRVPSPKMLLEEGLILLRKEFEHGSHLTVYNSGYVLFSAGKRNTVFHIHDCQGDYKGKPAPSDTPMTARKRLEEKRPNTFIGRSFGVGDVIVWDEEKGRKFFYVDKEELVEFGGFMDADAAGNTVIYMVPNYQIDGKTGTWLPYDSEVVEGVCFFMMRNEQRKDAVSPVVVDSKGVFVTDAPNGFENVRSTLTEYVQRAEKKQQDMTEHEKCLTNGTYERARESGTEQNYDMIDGCVNNVPKKPRRIGGRWSVLDRLHIKQAQRKQKDQTQQQQQERSRKN